MYNLLRWAFLTAAALWLTACQENDKYEGMRTNEESLHYQALNDSMLHMAPGVLDTIRQRMDKATDSLTWYDYYLMYGRHYLLSDKPELVLPYTRKTLQYVNSLPQQTPRTRGLASVAVSSEAAYYLLLHQRPDSVLKLYHEAYRLMMRSDMTVDLPDLVANLGDAYVAQGNLPEGARWYRRALYLNDSLGLPQKQTLTLYMGLGRIYTSLHDFKQAGEYYREADKRFDEMQPNIQSYFLNNYGNYYYFRKEYPKALETFRRLKAHIERYDARENFDMYLCKINMADVFLNLGQTDSARLYVAEAERYFREQQVDVGVYYAQTIRIGIAVREERYQEVEKILREDGVHQTADPDMQAIRDDYLNTYYAAIGDYRRAYKGMRGKAATTDSAEYYRRDMQTSEIMTRLTEDTIRLHHQLAINQQEVKYARSRAELWMVVALLALIILAFVVWFNYERKRRLQSNLDMLMLRIANTRQRVSPHFVFNIINAYIANSDEEETQQLKRLAQLIRTNLDLTQKNYVTLEEELDFARQYVDIERKLIGKDFEFSINAPAKELLQQVKVPAMLVQIMVENAILHGLKDKEGQKRLLIKVDMDEALTRISVIDNGPGFDIRKMNGDRSRTGLNIIRTTVSVINKENKKEKMHFDIHNDNGCQATLTIPRNIKLI